MGMFGGAPLRRPARIRGAVEGRDHRRMQGDAIQAAETHSESRPMPARMKIAAQEPIYLSVPVSHKTFICH